MNKVYDSIIIGGGPAGISAALYLHRAGKGVLVIDEGKSALLTAEKIENYYGVAQSGKQLFETAQQNAKSIGVQILRQTVSEILPGNQFTVKADTDYFAKTVLIATGSRRNRPNIKNLEKFEGKGVSYCATCDGFLYRGKTVAVIGFSDQAVSEAAALHVCEKIYLLTNQNALEKNVNGVIIKNNKIISFEGEDRLNAVVFEDGEKLPLDGVFIAYGSAGAFEFAKRMGLRIDQNGSIFNTDTTTNIKGIFVAGDCAGTTRQVVKAADDGRKAAVNIINYLKKV